MFNDTSALFSHAASIMKSISTSMRVSVHLSHYISNNRCTDRIDVKIAIYSVGNLLS